jgi:hypothetical protein
MVCTKCGIIGADARPNWREQPARESLTGAVSYHTPARARRIAGLSGFLTLTQSRDGPER